MSDQGNGGEGGANSGAGRRRSSPLIERIYDLTTMKPSDGVGMYLARVIGTLVAAPFLANAAVFEAARTWSTAPLGRFFGHLYQEHDPVVVAGRSVGNATGQFLRRMAEGMRSEPAAAAMEAAPPTTSFDFTASPSASPAAPEADSALLAAFQQVAQLGELLGQEVETAFDNKTPEQLVEAARELLGEALECLELPSHQGQLSSHLGGLQKIMEWGERQNPTNPRLRPDSIFNPAKRLPLLVETIESAPELHGLRDQVLNGGQFGTFAAAYQKEALQTSFDAVKQAHDGYSAAFTSPTATTGQFLGGIIAETNDSVGKRITFDHLNKVLSVELQTVPEDMRGAYRGALEGAQTIAHALATSEYSGRALSAMEGDRYSALKVAVEGYMEKTAAAEQTAEIAAPDTAEAEGPGKE